MDGRSGYAYDRDPDPGDRAGHLRPLSEEPSMNTPNTLRETWGTIKARLRQHYAELTDNDLAYIHGEVDEIIGRIQARTGASREDILRIMDAAQEHAG